MVEENGGLGLTKDRVAGDNDEILALIKERLAFGLKTYGHGINVLDDTREWGTDEDSWVEMGLEEMLDLALYLGAACVRIRHIEADALRVREELEAKRRELEAREVKVSVREKRLADKGGDSWWKRWVGNRS